MREGLWGKDSEKPLRILGSKQINLDEDPSLEILVLSQSGQSEAISAYKKLEGEWKFLWKQEFNLMSMGENHYELSSLNWKSGQAPGRERKSLEGDCIKRIVVSELPGDGFNSVFMEVLVDEPPIGLFSVPFVYRKGSKVLDGFQLKEHPELVRTKRIDFDYNEKEKSFRIFPTNPNYAQEFVFNGFEFIPNVPMQPVPSLVSVSVEPKFELGKESKVILYFKNRGNFTSVTYLSLSFPEGGKFRFSETSQGVKIYQIGQSVYNTVLRKLVPAEKPLLEATKESWSTGFKYGVSFYFIPESKEELKVLLRTSYRLNRDVFTIPNRDSIFKTEIDQQGFPSYPLVIK
ncbi:putative lipoprotein [Leptospira ryugenii]|uniref:Putative lipoprotein n=2 Tax=Leptospira ryugenii TaxID=1917863 RepID=A0A2P2E2V8_9LEPT|nr:putative lipoprotein [Leptospira ryugenii]